MRHYEAQAEVRKHYYLNKYVAIAPKRTHSLHHIDYPKDGILKEPPLESESSLLEIPGKDGQWAVKVIRNLYPAFSLGNKNAYGAQEVILETNPSDKPFGQLSVEQLLRVFEAYRQRLAALRKIKGIHYISIFHNDGLEAGTSVKQTHSQLIALGLVPPQIVEEAKVFSQLKQRYGGSPLGRALAWEEEKHKRIIYSDKHLAVLAPYASEHPYEAWLIPRREVDSITGLNNSELEALGRNLKALTMTLNSERVPFNFQLIEPAKGYDNHFMVKLTPRPNIWAGFELNTGIPINPVAPEDAAEWYRTFIKEHNAF